MSCPHGNLEGECDLCAALDAKWDAGYAAGKKTAAVEIEAVRASALVEIDILRAENVILRNDVAQLKQSYANVSLEANIATAENAALREQLQGGVVVPREPTEAMLVAANIAETSYVQTRIAPYNSDHKFKAIYRAMLAAAKETKE